MQAVETISQREYLDYFRAATNIETVHLCSFRNVSRCSNGKVVLSPNWGVVGYILEFVKSFFTSSVRRNNSVATNDQVASLRNQDVRIVNTMHHRLEEILARNPKPTDYYTLRTARLIHKLRRTLHAWNGEMLRRMQLPTSLRHRVQSLFEKRVGYAIMNPISLIVDLEVPLGLVGRHVEHPECAQFRVKVEEIRTRRFEPQSRTMLHEPYNLFTLNVLGQIGWSPQSAQAHSRVMEEADQSIALLARLHSERMILDRYAMDDFIETFGLVSQEAYSGIRHELISVMVESMLQNVRNVAHILEFAESLVFHARLAKWENLTTRTQVPVSRSLLDPINRALQSSCKSYSKDELTHLLRSMLRIAKVYGYLEHFPSIHSFASELVQTLQEFGAQTGCPQGELKVLCKDMCEGILEPQQIADLQTEFN